MVCSGGLLLLLLLVDLIAGAFSTGRAALWCGLALLLLAILVPDRVTAGAGWVAACGPVRKRRVRTDRLVRVRWPVGVAERVVLQDRDGARVELDIQDLTHNPLLWHLVAQGARASLERGTLASGATDWDRLAERIDGEAARLVFRVSGLG